MAELTAMPGWESMPLKEKFSAVCARTFAEEEMGARGIPVEMVQDTTVIDEILDGVFKHKDFDLR